MEIWMNSQTDGFPKNGCSNNTIPTSRIRGFLRDISLFIGKILIKKKVKRAYREFSYKNLP